MKKLFFLITGLLSTTFSSAQYGQEGAILAASEALIRAIETDQLNKIAKVQDEITVYHLAIAATSAEIVIIEQQLLDAQGDVRPWIQNLSSVYTLVKTAKTLEDSFSNILDKASANDKLMAMMSIPIASLIIDTATIVADYSIAFKNADTNLLNNQQRIEILQSAQDRLDFILAKTGEVNQATNAILTVLNLGEGTADMKTFDRNSVILSNQQTIDNLIIE